MPPQAGPYEGFEQGPIRPPSEAFSLLIRVTRNCPWNRCTFCPVYKNAKFSLRPAEHVMRDVDAVHRHVATLRGRSHREGTAIARTISPEEMPAFVAAFNWCFAGGMQSVFLQDANSLVCKTPDLVAILNHLGARFPGIARVTSSARAQTLARKSDDDLRALREAGLNRIHVGLESGSDQILARVRKGVTRDGQIQAGLKVKKAGMELSEYFMPGLGGRELWEENARQSAAALNRINPDFIRIRTLAIPPLAPLFAEWEGGEFDKCTDLEVARELLTFIQSLDGITSVVKSDHVLNLFGDLEGTLPEDKDRMIGILRTFLDLEPERRMLYQAGRRLGVFAGLADLDDPRRTAAVEATCRRLGVTPENVDAMIDEMMKRFV